MTTGWVFSTQPYNQFTQEKGYQHTWPSQQKTLGTLEKLVTTDTQVLNGSTWQPLKNGTQTCRKQSSGIENTNKIL